MFIKKYKPECLKESKCQNKKRERKYALSIDCVDKNFVRKFIPDELFETT